MAKKANRKCKVCGLEYYFCPNCNSALARMEPKWKVIYCSENCKTIFDTVVNYNCGIITNKEASEALKDADFSKLDDFTDDIKRVIKEVSKVKVVDKNNDVE